MPTTSLLGINRIQEDVGDASTSFLGSIYAILGDPATTFTSQLASIAALLGVGFVITGEADAGSTTLLLIDAGRTEANDYFNGQICIFTSGANVGLSRTIVDWDLATTTMTFEVPFPAAIAAGDDYQVLPRDFTSYTLIGANNNNNKADTSLVVANIDGSVLERLEELRGVQTIMSETKASPVYLDIGGEQDILTEVGVSTRIVNGMWFDMSNMLQGGTFKIYYKIDGTNYRLVSSEAWAITDEPGVYFNLNMCVSDGFKVTWTESADNGVAVTIPSLIVREVRA